MLPRPQWAPADPAAVTTGLLEDRHRDTRVQGRPPLKQQPFPVEPLCPDASWMLYVTPLSLQHSEQVPRARFTDVSTGGPAGSAAAEVTRRAR